MFLRYVLLAAAVVCASPTASEWYIPGDIPFVERRVSLPYDWQGESLSIGINVCPQMNNGDAGVLIRQSGHNTTGWRCLNLMTGAISQKYGDHEPDTIAPTSCRYSDRLSRFERDSFPFKEIEEDFWSYLLHFRKRWVKKEQGLVCRLQSDPLSSPRRQLTPTTFTAEVLGDETTELVAEFVDANHRVLGSGRVALVSSPKLKQLVTFSVNVADDTELQGKNTTLRYGVVPKGEDITNAIRRYSTPYYFTLPDVYKVKNIHFVLGQKGKATIEYKFDAPHSLGARFKENKGHVERILFKSRSRKQHGIYVPKGSGSFEIMTDHIIDPKKYQAGEKIAIVLQRLPSTDGLALDKANYPDFEFSVVVKKPTFLHRVIHSF